ncbi:MAG: endopeptidase La [Bacteroidetes bacterium GWA2_30_7]|nr:MAG: endopeptidase La [Bacteroidetes bacterium GWA2_30_7]
MINEFYLDDEVNENSELIPIIDENNFDISKDDILPDSLLILPLRNTVMFPGVILPISIGRDKSIKLIKDANKKNKLIGTVAQIDGNIEDPEEKDLYRVGTVAQIIKILQMPDGSTSVIIQGKSRFKIEEITAKEPYFHAKISKLDDIIPKKKDDEFSAIVTSLKELSIKIIHLSSNIPPEASFAVKNIENSQFLINFISSNGDIIIKDKQALLEENDLKIRGINLLEHITKQLQMLELKNQIQHKVKTDLDQQQREFLLHQQMKQIQEELGGSNIDKEIEEMKKKAKKKKWTKNVETTFQKEIEKLQRLNPVAGEYSVQLNYVQTLLDIPWQEYTKDRLDLKIAQRILNEDHYGLELIKERILEYLAVLKLKGDLKSPILCLYGPPGVGKTSLGKSIARALKRNYVRMSLGGLHDEAEIRGHRKTYIGAMPGRIIQNIKKAKSSNPVFILDEIDKVGNDFRGDPSSALLEVLDPEQNNAFYDNYLELEYDLSNVMFIATANMVTSIHPALRDRMEMINVSGYIVEEKIEIAKRHLIPKQLDLHGVKRTQVKFSNEILEHIVENYTRESGVRELDKKIAKVIRQIAKRIALKEEYNNCISIKDLKTYLGVSEYNKDFYQGNEYAGVVTGLAWTAHGGEILYIETSLSQGKGKLTLTGNLGEVMKESAVIALEYLKANSKHLELKPDDFENWNVHVHVPEGAIPKDGPSAGITMITSLASAFTQRKVKKGLAMTGEITLRGKVLPVGGIKEKILAAKRANITEIILSADNKKDIDQINEIYIKGLTFHFVENTLDVLKIALLKEQIKNPLLISKQINEN